MWRMPASTNASYVGMLAPPGYPNTTSTPSALRHSMMASTARMTAPLGWWDEEAGSGGGRGPILTGAECGFRGNLLVRVLELGPAAGAEGVVELDHLPAAGALAPRLVDLQPVEDGDDHADHRHARADEEPDEERGAL